MAVRSTEQYRPISTERTAADDAVDVAQIRDLADSMTNAGHRVFGPVLSQMWPRAGSSGDTIVSSTDNDSDENVILRWPRILCNDTTYHWDWSISGQMKSGASGSTTWRLRAFSSLYNGPSAAIDVSQFDYRIKTSGSLVIDSTTHQIKDAIAESGGDGLGTRNNLGRYALYFVLTAQNSTAASGEYSFLTGITITGRAF